MLKRASATLIALLYLAAQVRAEWKIDWQKTEQGRAAEIEYRQLTLADSQTDGRATIELALFPAKSFQIRVIDNPAGSDSLGEVMERTGSLAGVNGGYFGREFEPIGLLISDGRAISPLRRARLLTAVLCSSTRGIEIARVGEFTGKRKLDSAIECGPFLVDFDGRVGGLDRSRAARRTFACVNSAGKAAVGISTELTLAQLATVLSTVSLRSDFKTSRAMNLDGGSSTGFWFVRENGRPISIPEQKPVRDFVAISPRQ